MRKRIRSSRWVALALTALVACGGKGVTDSTSPPVKPDTTPTVQRTSLTVRVQIDPADATIASTAGVGVSGLTVRLTKAGSSDAPLVATTDGAGSVKFDNLLDGSYTASVERTLSAAELARLAPADRDASVFAGGVTTPVSPPTAVTTLLSLVGARRGSLVISEIFNYEGTPTPYNWATYLEVYNNSDTTVYLDGMYLGRTSWLFLQTTTFADCGEPSYLPFRTDSTRIWVQGGLRFPGSGRQFAVPPGAARVYAADALDHRTASGSTLFPNLSTAQFEHYASSSDTDNPTAENMLPVFGTTTGSSGRGLRTDGPNSFVLARSSASTRIQTATLTPLKTQDGSGVPFTPQDVYSIPREDVLDVVSRDYSPDYKAYLAATTFRYTLCQPWLPTTFERSPAEVNDYRRPGAIRRRSLGRTADGREILMRTGTSARDFEITTNLLQRSLNKSP